MEDKEAGPEETTEGLYKQGSKFAFEENFSGNWNRQTEGQLDLQESRGNTMQAGNRLIGSKSVVERE